MTGSSWRDIAADLRALIESGELPAGSRLPTEAEIAQQYGVQRNIVRLAMAELVAEGLVVRRRRLGTFVRDRDPVRVPFSVYQSATALPDERRGPWETACAALGIDGRTDVIGVEQVPATSRIAGQLAIGVDETVVRRTRHMLADGHAAQIQHAYYPLALVDGTPLAGAGKVVGGAHAALAAAGIVPATASFWSIARLPTSDERDVLDLAPSVPVLETWRLTCDNDGRPVELLQVISHAEMTTLVFDDLPLGDAHD